MHLVEGESARNSQGKKKRKETQMKNTYSKTRHTFIENGKPMHAIVYGGLVKPDEAMANCIIEDLGEGFQLGRYMLTISNDSWISDDLAELETRLFEWMQRQGYEYDLEK